MKRCNDQLKLSRRGIIPTYIIYMPVEYRAAVYVVFSPPQVKRAFCSKYIKCYTVYSIISLQTILFR